MTKISDSVLPATATFTERDARAIMGADVFGVPEAINHFGINPSRDECRRLHRVPFAENTLRQCAGTHFLYVDFALSVMNVLYRQKHEYVQKGHVCQFATEHFATHRDTLVQWRLIRKSALAGSVNASFERQLKALGPGEFMPSARDLVYAATAYHALLDQSLFGTMYALSRDLDSAFRTIVVGSSTDRGVRIETLDRTRLPSAQIGMIPIIVSDSGVS